MKLFGLENHFYHSSVRRYVALFGSLFTELYIKRTAGEKEEFILVPIKYGSGNMYLKAPQDETRDIHQHGRSLPAMAFQLESMYKDVDRKTNPMNIIQQTEIEANGKKNFQYNRVPYNFVFELDIITKNTDDMLQIIEQVLPAFDGNLSVTIEDTTGLSVEQDIIIRVQEIEIKDNYDDEMKSRLLEWKITFELKGYLYKRTQLGFAIKEIDIMQGLSLDYMPFTEIVTDIPTQELLTKTADVFDVSVA